LLLDAAMGTRLIARGLVPPHDNTASWNLKHPEVVAALHRADVEAGADAVVTNTFQANPRVLHAAGRLGDFEAINRRGVELAREAVGPGRFVLGSLAPHEAGRGTVEQAALLADLGVDALLLETWEAPFLARVAARLRESVPNVPLLGNVYRLKAEDGDPVRLLIGKLNAFGMNCLPPPEATAGLRSISGLNARGIPLIMRPSASLPGMVPDSPERFAQLVPEWLRLGARLLGGCCGTTEEHLAAMRRALDEAMASP